MTNLIQKFESQQLAKIQEVRNPEDFNLKFKVGDTVRVKYKISEGGTTRLQAFIGVVIAKSKSFSNYSATFTVRKISAGIGVERKFTLYSPLVASIEIMKKGVVRRSKLYYLRELTGKAARIREKLDFVGSANNSVSKQTKTEGVQNKESEQTVKEAKVEQNKTDNNQPKEKSEEPKKDSSNKDQ